MIAAAWYLAFQLRFDFEVPPYYETMLRETIVFVVAIKLAVFVAFGFYQRWWRYVSTRDMWRAVGVAVASVLAIAAVYFFYPVERLRLPRGVALVDPLLLLAFVAGSRLLARTVIERPKGGLVARGKEVLIVGAGDAGELIVRELQRSRALGYTPIGLVDDDPRKRGMRLLGVRVLGTTDELPHILRDNRPDEVLIAAPSAPGEFRRRVVEVAARERVPVKTLPALHELISRRPRPRDPDPPRAGRGRARPRAGRGRPALGRVVPRRQDRARHRRGRLDRLRALPPDRARPAPRGSCSSTTRRRRCSRSSASSSRSASSRRACRCSPTAGTARSSPGLRALPARGRLPRRGVQARAADGGEPGRVGRNNVLATRCVADVAVEFGAERFVLVSTDKAANPKTVMGQSKALCEWVVETYGHRDDVPTRFVAVRFGNVLGSSGSVVPIFRRQLERGGPLTVTHPEMTRYFMTIPEAVVARRPGRRDRRSRRGLRARHGRAGADPRPRPEHDPPLGPEPDVRIEFVGARPGREAPRGALERRRDGAPTAHPKISRATREPVDPAWLEEELNELERLVAEGDTLELVSRLATIVARRCAHRHRSRYHSRHTRVTVCGRAPSRAALYG